MANVQNQDGTGFKQDMHNLGQGVNTLKADVGNLAHGAADAVRSGVSELRQGAQHAVEVAKDKLHDAGDMAREKYQDAKKTAAHAADSMKTIIVENPIKSIGVAVGLGMLLGLYFFRSRS